MPEMLEGSAGVERAHYPDNFFRVGHNIPPVG
jgi:hypothetical protein